MSFKNLIVSLVFFFFVGLSSLFSQTGVVRGYVYDGNSGEPVLYANVFLEGSTFGANTDYNGFYNLSAVPVGKYQILATFIGYDTARVTVNVTNGGIANINLNIKESSVIISEVSVSASRESARNEVKISKVTVTPKQIKSLPSVGGDADIAQYIQVLPGVVSTGDQGGQIYIRGGSPVQNKILLDGLNIYNPFHSLGFYSVFETELIRNVDVLTGGFGAEYGGRISAVVDIKTREGDKKNLGGYASVSPFMGKLLLEGPISKFEEGKGSISFVLTSKKSLIERTSKNLYKYAADVDSVGLPFAFQDSYGKLSIVSANGSKFNVFGFNFTDNYNNPGLADINWKNVGAGGNFRLIPNTANMIIDATVGVTDYQIGIDEGDNNKRSSGIKEFGANVDFIVYGNNNEFDYGFELKAITTDFNFINPFGLFFSQNQNTTEMSTYLKYRQKIGNLIIEPSMRLVYYAAHSKISPEPRIGLKYNVTNKLRLKAAGGYYTQNILGTSAERDVVNLFSGFLTGPESRILDPQGNQITNKLQQSRHAVGGIEYDLTNEIQVNIEGYIKDYPQIIVVNRNKTEASQSDYSTEKGEAYGAELSVKYDRQRFNVWMTYSYGFVNRNDGEQVYPTVFDRRHNANLLATYNFDKKGDFSISARWNLGSGFPFTQTQGFYNHLNFSEGLDTDYLTSNPEDIGIIYSDSRNGGRLPYYHRLDISATRKFTFSKRTGLELVAGVTNAYDRDNIFYFDRVRYTRVNQLPILPSLSAKFYF